MSGVTTIALDGADRCPSDDLVDRRGGEPLTSTVQRHPLYYW